MFDGIEKKLFGSGLTVLMVIMYFEIRDLRIQIKSIETRLDQHIFLEIAKDCKESKAHDSVSL